MNLTTEDTEDTENTEDDDEARRHEEREDPRRRRNNRGNFGELESECTLGEEVLSGTLILIVGRGFEITWVVPLCWGLGLGGQLYW